MNSRSPDVSQTFAGPGSIESSCAHLNLFVWDHPPKDVTRDLTAGRSSGCAAGCSLWRLGWGRPGVWWASLSGKGCVGPGNARRRSVQPSAYRSAKSTWAGSTVRQPDIKHNTRRNIGLCNAGCFNLGKGQFTDDTELALSLANGLLLHNGPSQSFPAEQVAQQYVRQAACSILCYLSLGPTNVHQPCIHKRTSGQDGICGLKYFMSLSEPSQAELQISAVSALTAKTSL